MKSKHLAIIVAALALLLGACSKAAAGNPAQSGPATREAAPGVSAREEAPTQGEAQQVFKNTAMYVPYGDGQYILVDQDTGSIFTVTIPEAIYGIAGDKIAPDALQKGNIVEITGNGTMLYSYPGQYPGVTEIRVIREGTPADADAYQSIVDQIYTTPDPAEPSVLNAEYRTPLAAVAATVTRGGYEWEYTDEKGETVSTVACGAHVLQWREMNALALTEPTSVTLRFFPYAATAVNAVRWPVSLYGLESGDRVPEGESVAVTAADGAFVLKAEPGYVYSITGIFEQGNVKYAFLTK